MQSFFYFLAFFACAAFAQGQSLILDSYLEDAGLEQQEVADLACDADGNVWVAASDGLSFYDGYTWTRYTTEDGLPSNIVRSVCITQAGAVWVGTDQGAARLQGERFTSSEIEGKLPGVHVAQVEQSMDGTLWFLCDTWNQLDLAGGIARWKDGDWATWTELNHKPISGASHMEATEEGCAILLDGILYLADGDDWRKEQFGSGAGSEPFGWEVVGNDQGVLLIRSDTSLHLLPGKGRPWVSLPDPCDYDLPFVASVSPEGVPRVVDNLRDAALREWDGTQWRSLGSVLPSNRWLFNALFTGKDGDLWLFGAGSFQRVREQSPRWNRIGSGPEEEEGVFSGVDGQGGVWFHREDGIYRRNPAGVIDQRIDPGEVWPSGDGAMWHFRSDGTIGIWDYYEDDSDGDWYELLLPKDGKIVQETLLLDSTGQYWTVLDMQDGTWSVAGIDAQADSSWEYRQPPTEVQRDEIILSDSAPNGGIIVLHRNAELGRYGLTHVSTDGLRQLDVPSASIRDGDPWMLVNEEGDIWLYGVRGLWQLPFGGDSFRRVSGLQGEVVLDLNHQPGRVAGVVRARSGGRSALALISSGEDPQVLQQWDIRVDSCIGRGASDELYFLEADKLLEVPVDTSLPVRSYSIPPNLAPESATRTGDGVLRLADSRVSYEFRPGTNPPMPVLAKEELRVRSGDPCLLSVSGIEYGMPRAAAGPMFVAKRLGGEDWSDWERLDKATVDLGDLGPGDHAVEVRLMDQSGTVGVASTQVHVVPVPLRNRFWFTPLLASLALTLVGLSGWALYSKRRISELAAGLQGTVQQRNIELATSEARYSSLFLQASEGLVVLGETGLIQDTNPAARQLLGLGGDDGFGLEFVGFLEDPSLHSKYLEGKETLVSCHLVTRQGKKVEVLLGCSPIEEPDSGPARYRVSLQDLGARKYLEQALALQQEQLDLALTGSSGATWEVRTEFKDGARLERIRVSQRLLEQLGFSPSNAPKSVTEWQDRIHPEDRAALPKLLENNHEPGTEEYSSVYRMLAPSGEYRWVRSIARRSNDVATSSVRWFGVHWDVTEQMRRQIALEEREARYRRLAENLPGFVLLIEAKAPYRIVFVTSQITQLLGYSVEEIVGDEGFYQRVSHPEDKELRAKARESMANGKALQFQARGRHANGTWRWFEVSLGQVVRESIGDHVEGYVQDITDRLRKEEQGRLIMRELDHRVKNTLATVVAISDRTRAGSATLEGFDEAFRGRIRTLAQVHEALAGGGWVGVNVRTLLQRCMEPYQREACMTLEGPEVELPVDAVTTFSMALNELSTNAAKYGALSVPDGRIHVGWKVVGDREAEVLELQWTESGGPPVVVPQNPGFGTRLIRQGIAYEQRGSVEMDFEPGGLCCRLRIPLSATSPRPSPLDPPPGFER